MLATTPTTGCARGFTLVELLVACFLLLAVIGAVVAMATPARYAFERTLGGADLSGGTRAALELLTHDLREAGSGAGVGRPFPSLADVAPVILPLADLGSTAVASPARAVRSMRVEAGAPQGVLSQPAAAGGSTLQLDTSARCVGIAPACGFAPGLTAVVFDRARSTIVHVAAVSSGGLVQLAASLPSSFDAGAIVAALSITAYGVRPNLDGSGRLVRLTGGGAEQPILQGVVGFEVHVKGRGLGPQPGLTDEAVPDYGPAPPPVGEDDERDAWLPGENCTTRRDGAGIAIPRLGVLGDPRDPVPLPATALGDGPWCADFADPSAFDADLLRIGEVEVRLRVEALSPVFRGPAGYLFRRAGTESNAARWVPDIELRVTVSVRNRP